MRVEFIERCSDHTGQVLDIYADNISDSFKLGILFEKISKAGMTIWCISDSKGSSMIRVPLIECDELGLAITYNKEKK